MAIIIDNAGGGGGGGTINNGVPPQHAYYSGINTIDSDPNMRKGDQGTEIRAISWMLVDGVTDQYYVATTGNDANDGSIGSPFLTIGRAMRQVNSNIRPGVIQINIADGTYNERFLVPNLFSVCNDVDYGQSVIKIVGNTATPANVVIQWNGGTVVWAVNSPIPIFLDGLTIQSNNLGIGAAGVWCENSCVILGNVDIIDCRNGIIATNNSTVIHKNTPNGGAIDGFDNCVVTDSSTFIIRKNLVCTGSRNSAFLIRNNGAVDIQTGTVNIEAGTGTNCETNFKLESGGVLKSIANINFDLNNANTTADSGAFIVEGGGIVDLGANCTINITDADIGGKVGDNSLWKNGSGCTFNYLGTTTAEWKVSDNSTIINTDSFTGAEITTNITAGHNYGLDWRYLNEVIGLVPTTYTLGADNYITKNGSIATYIPLYIASTDEIVDYFTALSQVSNGAAHTDVYTVVKNGVDQAMTFSITNGTSGTTTSNKVTLVSGDTLGIKVAADAASAAERIIIQMGIRKTA